jgi:DNA-binding NtrC family response regulator
MGLAAGVPAKVAAGDAINLTSLNVADAERVLIQHALAASDNNRTKAAELLGISVRTLRNKLNGPGRDSEPDEE